MRWLQPRHTAPQFQNFPRGRWQRAHVRSLYWREKLLAPLRRSSWSSCFSRLMRQETQETFLKHSPKTSISILPYSATDQGMSLRIITSMEKDQWYTSSYWNINMQKLHGLLNILWHSFNATNKLIKLEPIAWVTIRFIKIIFFIYGQIQTSTASP